MCIMSNTEENLKKAFAGESQAYRMYRVFADKAVKEGYPQVAKLFRAAAESEGIHAQSLLRIMRKVKPTADNLQAAIEGETYEYTDMYPQFMREATGEGRKDAFNIFEEACKTEEFHAKYYKQALEQVKQKKDLPVKEYYICTVCGYTVEDKALDECPVCRAKKSFKPVD